MARLVALGWLEKRGSLYRTTATGHRQFLEADRGRSWDALEQLYPPLTRVPTAVHRALAELTLAAVVARQHGVREDRHPFFVVCGATLHWKTSLGRFLCYALGLDPTLQIVECGTETGKSLAVRRGADGALISKRALLETPFVVLDEFLHADATVRSTLNLFLAGRLTVPVENEQLTVRPVSLLTLNPLDKPTLEARVGLSTPLIRRALLANLDAVPMPDLATIGERAIEAARSHPPLRLNAPRIDAQTFRDDIVSLARAILVPDAHDRIDVEILINLASGMSAFIAEPLQAIAQVLHGVGLVAETLGWTRPGWIESVAGFRLNRPLSAVPTSVPDAELPPSAHSSTSVMPARGAATIAFGVPPPLRRRTSVPDLDLSPDLRGRLIWLAVDSQQPLEDALSTLLDFYLEWRESKKTIGTMAATLRLAEKLGLVEVDVQTVHDYLETRDRLGKHGCDFTDVPEALRLIEMLQVLPFAWTWKQARQTVDAIVAGLEGGIELAELARFLERHRHLEVLGFSDEQAVTVAAALDRAGAIGDRRDDVVEALVNLAGREVDHVALEAKQSRLEKNIARLEATAAQLTDRVQELRDEVNARRQDLSAIETTQADIQTECDQQLGALAVAHALRKFLLGRTAETDALWKALEPFLRWRTFGGRAADAYGQLLTKEIRREMFAFLQRLVAELAQSSSAEEPSS